MGRPGYVAALVGVALAHIQQQYPGVVGLDAAPHLLQRHEGDIARGGGDQLLHGLAAAEVGAQGLRQVIGLLQSQGAHLGDEVRPLFQLQARIARHLLGQRGIFAVAVDMCRVDPGGRVQQQQAVEQAVVQLLGVAAGQVGAAAAADQQGVAGEHPVLDVHADRVRGVPRRVQDIQRQFAEVDLLAVVHPQVDVGRGAVAVHDHRHVAVPAPSLWCRRNDRRGCGCPARSECARPPGPPARGSGRSGFPRGR